MNSVNTFASRPIVDFLKILCALCLTIVLHRFHFEYTIMLNYWCTSYAAVMHKEIIWFKYITYIPWRIECTKRNLHFNTSRKIENALWFSSIVVQEFKRKWNIKPYLCIYYLRPQFPRFSFNRFFIILPTKKLLWCTQHSNFPLS